MSEPALPAQRQPVKVSIPASSQGQIRLIFRIRLSNAYRLVSAGVHGLSPDLAGQPASDVTRGDNNLLDVAPVDGGLRFN